MIRGTGNSEKKRCTVCGSNAFRIVSSEYGKKTYYAFQEAEMIDETTPRARPTGVKYLLEAFGCSNRTCGHVDFYTYMASKETKP